MDGGNPFERLDAKYETLREQHRPARTVTLFVGESRPAGNTFFYSTNSNLYRYMREAFGSVFGQDVGTGSDFLLWFKDHGYFLEDMVVSPVNHLNPRERKRVISDQVNAFQNRLRSGYCEPPKHVITVKMTIADFVVDTLRNLGWNDVIRYHLPFPASGQQRRFRVELEEILRDLRSS